MVDVNRIIKDCFWEFNFSEDDIINMSKGNVREQKFLFSKILENSHELLQDMEIFDLKSIEMFLETYTVPKFNEQYLFRRKNILEVHFLKKPLLIKELQWQI